MDEVSLSLMPGRVHALVGENGAGKTTLMNLLYGIHQPDQGRILIDGEDVRIRRPADAIKAGIALVHQHFSLVPSFTVAENLMLVQHRDVGVVPDRSRFVADVQRIGNEYGLEVNPNARAIELPLGLRQRVEILGGLVRDARILILDEPTTILAPSQIGSLFTTLRKIALGGRAVVLITHRLAEVFEIAETFSVMRQGQLVSTAQTSDSSPEQVARLMVGREFSESVSQRSKPPEAGKTVLQVRNVSLPPDEASPGLSNVSFELEAGQIVAIAGVEGNGQRQLVEVLAGLASPTSGQVLVNGNDIKGKSRRQGAKLGLQVIPEDRQAEGLVLKMTLVDNVTLDRVRDPKYSVARVVLRMSSLRRFARQMIERFQVRASSEQTPVRMLSGGNQQRVVIARVMSSSPRVLVAAQPTRGLDIAATRYVLDQLREASGEGMAVLLISSDLEQVMSVADHILVFFKGRIVGSIPSALASRERLGLYMSGVVSDPEDPSDPDSTVIAEAPHEANPAVPERDQE